MHRAKDHLLSSHERQQPYAVTAGEQRNAKAQGVTIEVYRLQQRLRKLPMVPREDWLRKKRADLVNALYVAARRDRCLSQINPWAACDSNIPPIKRF